MRFLKNITTCLLPQKNKLFNIELYHGEDGILSTLYSYCKCYNNCLSIFYMGFITGYLRKSS